MNRITVARGLAICVRLGEFLRNAMENIVPIVSVDTCGPLGLKHLPRLWAKALLHAHGRLAPGYKPVMPGLDFIVLEGIGLAPEKVRDYIFGEKPTYLQFENWLSALPEADVSPENIARINQLLVERKKAPDMRAQILAENDLPLDSPWEDVIMLNNLEDWREFHEALKR